MFDLYFINMLVKKYLWTLLRTSTRPWTSLQATNFYTQHVVIGVSNVSETDTDETDLATYTARRRQNLSLYLIELDIYKKHFQIVEN